MIRTWMVLVVGLMLVLEADGKEALRVLMIGNSYTAGTRNEIKAFLAADPEIEVELVARCPGGKMLAQHAENPKVTKLLEKSGKWDVVVLQEQSQLPAFAMIGKEGVMKMLDAGAPVLIPRIMKSQPQARIFLFETWARHREKDKFDTLKDFGGKPEKMQAALTQGYQHLLVNRGAWDFSTKATIIPVGKAFAAWYAEVGYDKPELSLHRPDHSHPSKAGAYLTGAMFYQAITGRDPATTKHFAALKDEAVGKPLTTSLLEIAKDACKP